MQQAHRDARMNHSKPIVIDKAQASERHGFNEVFVSENAVMPIVFFPGAPELAACLLTRLVTRAVRGPISPRLHLRQVAASEKQAVSRRQWPGKPIKNPENGIHGGKHQARPAR